MRHIDGIYTQRYNRRKKTDGSLFRGRYKAIVIDASHYLLQVSRYIHRNPIELQKPLIGEKKGLKYSISLPKIIKTVAVYYEIPVSNVKHAKRGKGGKNLPRWVAMKLCQDVGGAKLMDIASIFNVGHYSTVSQTIGRLNYLMEEDIRVADVYNILSQDLTP